MDIGWSGFLTAHCFAGWLPGRWAWHWFREPSASFSIPSPGPSAFRSFFPPGRSRLPGLKICSSQFWDLSGSLWKLSNHLRCWTAGGSRSRPTACSCSWTTLRLSPSRTWSQTACLSGIGVHFCSNPRLVLRFESLLLALSSAGKFNLATWTQRGGCCQSLPAGSLWLCSSKMPRRSQCIPFGCCWCDRSYPTNSWGQFPWARVSDAE